MNTLKTMIIAISIITMILLNGCKINLNDVNQALTPSTYGLFRNNTDVTTYTGITDDFQSHQVVQLTRLSNQSATFSSGWVEFKSWSVDRNHIDDYRRDKIDPNTYVILRIYSNPYSLYPTYMWETVYKNTTYSTNINAIEVATSKDPRTGINTYEKVVNLSPARLEKIAPNIAKILAKSKIEGVINTDIFGDTQAVEATRLKILENEKHQ